MSTTFKTRTIAPLLAAAAMVCAGAAHADPLLDVSAYARLVGSNVGAVNGISFAAGTGLTVGADGSLPGAAWTGFGSASNLSAPIGSGAEAWLVSRNPFGNVGATKLAVTAASSNACQATGSCNNQSDDVGTTGHAVPEPETYALLAAGLGAIGFVAGRRRRY